MKNGTKSGDGALTIVSAKRVTFLAYAALACVAFTYLLPPQGTPDLAVRLLPFLSIFGGDRPLYAFRFLLSFLLLGILPFVLTRSFGWKPEQLGLRLPTRGFPAWAWAALAVGGIVSGAVSSIDSEVAAYYPYARNLIESVRTDGVAPFALHSVCYLFFYYLPWEFFFRGALVFPFCDGFTAENPDSSGNASSAALPLMIFTQVFPSTFLHFGHPAAETFAAIPAGFAFGILAWKSRSIFPGLVFHALAGLACDATIILRALGSH